MFLDLSTCIGCRACQVACKEWNDLPAVPTVQQGTYENPAGLSGDTWKQVKFIQVPDEGLLCPRSGIPTSDVKRSTNALRDSPTSLASASADQGALIL